MFLNYIRIAWRNFRKHSLYSSINTAGLGIGLAVCMLIMLYVAHELSFDRFHKDSARIFDVFAKVSMGADTVQIANMTYKTGPAVKEQDARVEDYLRMIKPHRPVVVKAAAQPGIKFSEKQFLFADSNFFRFFTFPLLEGNIRHVLERPFTVVLTKGTAERYFGKADPVGKMLRYNGTYDFEVTGIVEDAPSNSSLQYDFIASLSSFLNMEGNGHFLNTPKVGTGSFKTYFMLKSAADAGLVSKTMQVLHEKGSEQKGDETYMFTPLPDVHLNANFGDFSNTRYLKIFPLVAGLILLLALINYISLATARATLRAREVGVRKAMGAGRGGLARQFYIESALYAILAFALGIIIFVSSKSYFFQQLSLKIDTAFLFSPPVLAIAAGLLIITVLGAGSYPALLLSSFKPVASLYGKLSRQGGASIRKTFTVLQFGISIALIICGLVIDRQLDFFRHADTGVKKENILMVPFQASGNHYQVFKNDVASLAGIERVATAHYPMYAGYDMFFTKKANGQEEVALPVLSVDSSFITALGLQWKQAPASNRLITEEKKIIVNEAAIQKLGLPQQPAGSLLSMGNDRYEIVGVLKDFSFVSLHSKVEALSLFVSKDTVSGWNSAGGCLFAKITPGANMPAIVASIKQAYEKYDADAPFKYQFMDDAYDAMYKAEDRLARIFSVFTGLTVLIACLGLFGLAAFTAEQRSKEIGVRKVLGASVLNVITLLNKDFLKLVLIAIVLASPVAGYLMKGWLEDFAYRIELQWWMFAASGGCALLLAWVTVSFQSVRTALMNPVKALKSE